MDTKVIDRTGTAVRARELQGELGERVLQLTPTELALYLVKQLLNEGRP